MSNPIDANNTWKKSLISRWLAGIKISPRSYADKYVDLYQ